MNKATVGIDVGTTNSAIAIVNGSRRVQLTHFAVNGQPIEPYRSLLYLEQVRERGASVRTKSKLGIRSRP